MKKSKVVWILGIVAILAAAPALAGKVEFTEIEGGLFLVPQDMTADNSVMVLSGYFGAPYFTYTAEDGIVEIGGGGSGGVSISDDGSMIAGTAPNAEGAGEAAKYLGNGQWELMGGEPGALPCGSSLSSGYDTNGHTLVGLTWRAQLCRAIGGVWDLSSASFSTTLESGVPDRATRGNQINNDGTIIAGWSDNDFGTRRAARWVNGVMEILQDGEGNIYGEVIRMNSTGTVMAGVSYQFAGDGRGWLYREGEGFTPMGIGQINGQNFQSVPLDVTENGDTVIGTFRNFTQFIQWGWIWEEKFGFSRFDDWLKGKAGAGWQQMIPSVISHDGSIIAGYGINPDGQISSWILDREANKR